MPNSFLLRQTVMMGPGEITEWLRAHPAFVLAQLLAPVLDHS